MDYTGVRLEDFTVYKLQYSGHSTVVLNTFTPVDV